MEWIIFTISLFLFLFTIGIAIHVRKGLVQFTDELSDCLDDMLSGKRRLSSTKPRKL